MNQLSQTKIRFSDTVRAIGVKPKVLRNWLQRNQIILMSEHSGAKWSEFTLGDIAILALMKRLIRWGIGVQGANEIAYLLIVQKGGPLFQFKSTPKEALVALLGDWQLFVSYDEMGEIVTHTLSKQEYLSSEKSDFVFIDIGSVIDEAYQRLEQQTS